MKQLKATTIHVFLLLTVVLTSLDTMAQRSQKVKNQPFADQQSYHLGFMVGTHVQDMNIVHTGNTTASGESWFAEIPSYSVGLSIGIVGDRYINEYLNIRSTPTLHFGETNFMFREPISAKEYEINLRHNYISIPLYLKFSAQRIHNYRPYILAGGYANMNIGNKRDEALRFKKMDYGIEFGLGCNFYLPLFKLCPELKFSFGLVDIIDKNRLDLTDSDVLKYTEAISSGKTRSISLVFNFE